MDMTTMIKCPICNSIDIGDYKLTAGKGINWKGEQMYWCKQCGHDFTESTMNIVPLKNWKDIVAPERKKQATEKEQFYITNSGKKVYY